MLVRACNIKTLMLRCVPDRGDDDYVFSNRNTINHYDSITAKATQFACTSIRSFVFFVKLSERLLSVACERKGPLNVREP